MNDLQIPEALKGPWSHALFMTYGVNLPFFEHALWNQLPNRCRNRIVLADGHSYLMACRGYAQGDVLRYLNQRYVAAGVFCRHAAHAKVILLTNEEQGRLLVGSGNLGLPGYASGGELFTQYEYSKDAPENVDAFTSIRSLLDELLERGYVQGTVERHIGLLLEGSPWLSTPAAPHHGPVRHNFHHPFVTQLREVLGDRQIQELWILSPFYDRDAAALEYLLREFRPEQATLLMQRGQTSADPDALETILSRYPDVCRIHTCTRPGDDPYLHAKLYLFKLPDCAVCLQGSPNLSRVAMLLSGDAANIEVANLSVDLRDGFDYLLDALDISTSPVSLEDLHLSCEPDETTTDPSLEAWYLTNGELQGDALRLGFRGEVPNLSDAVLVIGGEEAGCPPIERDNQLLLVRLSAEASRRLSHPLPVCIRRNAGSTKHDSNPIYVYNRAALDAALEVNDDTGVFDGMGNLDLDLKDLEHLFGDLLDTVLVLDERSVWHSLRTQRALSEDKSNEGASLTYEQVDYDLLRSHPKMQQYRRSGGYPGYAPTRLQTILSAITEHVRGVREQPQYAPLPITATTELDEDSAEEQPESQPEDEITRKRRRSDEQRVRMIIKNFLKRYFEGIHSDQFREAVGVEVITKNYVIVQHILWTLFAKPWMEPEYVIQSLAQVWRFYWGSDDQDGYFHDLTEEQQLLVLDWIDEQNADHVMLASLYYGAFLSHIGRWNDARFVLRDSWRHMLLSAPWAITVESIVASSRLAYYLTPLHPPSPSEIVEELTLIAKFETRRSFIDRLRSEYGVSQGACRFERQKIFRRVLDRPDSVECLVLDWGEAPFTRDQMISTLREWRQFDDLDYYRIQSTHGSPLVYYDVLAGRAVYSTGQNDLQVLDIATLLPMPLPCDRVLAAMEQLASRAMEALVNGHTLAS